MIADIKIRGLEIGPAGAHRRGEERRDEPLFSSKLNVAPKLSQNVTRMGEISPFQIHPK